MPYKFSQNLVSSSKYSIKCPYSLTPEYVTVHDTANSASASNEVSYMISNSNQTSFHLAVDESNCIQGIPFNRNSWADGDGANGTGNRKSINVEICRPTNSNRSLYDKAEENAVYVLARLLYAYGLGIDKLKRHYDWSGKNCPAVILSEKRWESFKGRVHYVLGEIKAGRCASALSSGTTSITTTTTNTKQTQSVSKVETVKGEWKIKVLQDTNLWNDTNYKTVGGHVKKGQVLYVTEITKDYNFFVYQGKYLVNSNTYNYVTNMYDKPLGKIQVKQDCNTWSYANFNKVVGRLNAWDVKEYTDYKNGFYHVPYIGYVHESMVNKKLKLTDALVTN